MPFAALALIPLAQLIGGHVQTRAHALLIGIALVPVLAYAVDHWHGGLSRAMRYLIPALPMLAILSAVTLRRVGALEAKNLRGMIYSAVAGAFLIIGGLNLAGDRSVPEAIAFEYWPTMLVLAIVTLASAFFLVRPGSDRASGTLRLSGGVAIGAAMMISLTTLGWYQGRIGFNAARDQIAADRLAPGSLVLMQVEERFVRAKANGVGMMAIGSNRIDDLRAAEAAWTAAGRCTYIEASGAEVSLTSRLGGAWDAVELSDGFTLLTRTETAGRCAR